MDSSQGLPYWGIIRIVAEVFYEAFYQIGALGHWPIYFCFIVLLLAPGSGARDSSRRSYCQLQLKEIALACLQYKQDYDSRFPPVSTPMQAGWAASQSHEELDPPNEIGTRLGWVDIIGPYCRSWETFQCPAGYSPAVVRSSDYFYNAGLAMSRGKGKPEQTVVFGDGDDNGLVDAHLLKLPTGWDAPSESNDNSPMRRHRGGANYAFADGHVKWFMPTKIHTLRDDSRH